MAESHPICSGQANSVRMEPSLPRTDTAQAASFNSCLIHAHPLFGAGEQVPGADGQRSVPVTARWPRVPARGRARAGQRTDRLPSPGAADWKSMQVQHKRSSMKDETPEKAGAVPGAPTAAEQNLSGAWGSPLLRGCSGTPSLSLSAPTPRNGSQTLRA